jgi:hypothetical protein
LTKTNRRSHQEYLQQPEELGILSTRYNHRYHVGITFVAPQEEKVIVESFYDFDKVLHSIN